VGGWYLSSTAAALFFLVTMLLTMFDAHWMSQNG
jgi:hypothetical protein